MEVKSDKNKAVYGFYCSMTNQFYYVQSQQILEQLIAVMKEQNLNTKQKEQQNKAQSNQNLNDLYCRLMDEDIENILSDPIFAPRQDVQLKQYDF